MPGESGKSCSVARMLDSPRPPPYFPPSAGALVEPVLVFGGVASSSLPKRRIAAHKDRQGSSVVEQGTHKPLVGSSTLPPGTKRAFRLRRLEPIVRRAFRGPCRLPRGATLLVAVSGGADSTALLVTTASLGREFGLSIHAA